MNLGKYSVEDPVDEGTPQQEDRRGQENPQQGDQQARMRNQSSSGERRRVNPPQPQFTRFSGASFAQQPVLPSYWSTSYGSPPSQPGHLAQPTFYTGYNLWSPSLQSSAATESFPTELSFEERRPFLRSMARYHTPAPFVHASRKWTERGTQLHTKIHKDVVYSKKVFVGGLPAGMTIDAIRQAFQEFDVRRIAKKEREAHAYLLFESDPAVKNLLSKCEKNADGAYFFSLGTRNVQVIPWALQDAEWGQELVARTNYMIFVGGLHGETTAEHLKIIMEECFGQVRHVKIDTDPSSYPSGSARVQFLFKASYLEAIQTNYLEINTKHYTRTVQLEPFFERGRMCSRCQMTLSSKMCRYIGCLDYFCRTCFIVHQQLQGIFSNLHVSVGFE